jgi:hypothetical protein
MACRCGSAARAIRHCAATGNDAGAAKLSPDPAAPSRQSSTTGSFADRCPGADGGVCVRLDVTSFAGHIGHNARLDITHNERAVLITALRRFVDFDPQPLSPQIQALKAILERLEPQKPEPIPRYCEHRVNPPRRRAKAIDLLRGRICVQTPTQRGDRPRFQAPHGHRYASACCLGGWSSVASRVPNLLF